MAEKALVGSIMGSKSDLPAMEACTKQLEEFGVPYELVIASAHRAPAKVHEWASTAADRGLKVIIAAAGKAAHLGGVVAAYTPLPGASGAQEGVFSLYFQSLLPGDLMLSGLLAWRFITYYLVLIVGFFVTTGLGFNKKS